MTYANGRPVSVGDRVRPARRFELIEHAPSAAAAVARSRTELEPRQRFGRVSARHGALVVVEFPGEDAVTINPDHLMPVGG